MNINPEKDFIFPLASGGYGIVDMAKKHLVDGVKWYLTQREGVECHENKKRIFLHTLIVPYKYTFFKNGNKADCRIENLSKECVNKQSKAIGISDYKNGKSFRIQRSIFSNGKRFVWETLRSYKNRNKNDALKLAKVVRDDIYSYNRNEFLSFVKNRPKKRICYSEIISSFDCYKGRVLSYGEVAQMNIISAYDKDE